MRASDAAACNLFGCLTSLAVEEGSRRIENFCTESLACLLRNSCELQKTFFDLLRYSGPTSGFEFSTQVFVKSGDLRDAEKSYFDMVALNETERRAFIIEVKASIGFRPDQLPKYREAGKRKYQGYHLKLATLSPHLERPPTSDIHLCWDQIATATRQTRTPAATGIGIMNNGVALLWVEATINCNGVPPFTSLPAALRKPYRAAKKYSHKIDSWANGGRSKDGKTSLVFVQELDGRLETDSKAIVDWLKDTTLAAARFVSK